MKTLLLLVLFAPLSVFAANVSLQLCPQGAENSANHFVANSMKADDATGVYSSDNSIITYIIDGSGIVSVFRNNSPLFEMGKIITMPKLRDNCSSYGMIVDADVKVDVSLVTGNPYPLCTAADGFQCHIYRNQKSTIRISKAGQLKVTVGFDGTERVNP